ncbi:NPCBM/NEW2 domain-containing protein [Xanthomonas sp. AM6]|uniref:NPCBM/NEW2 domain-containing protein n=1 Tax=Xanthomonas sp. AM6 TaxID=2982531 RepID=UPI0021D90155|nr:NPCBM/NEW2 domain-containing protein [Xanthomonas sp. AM6]UYB51602.1 NPCBM/NEW2 domain-containing protein [Xanthomonas sp. AM6]
MKRLLLAALLCTVTVAASAAQRHDVLHPSGRFSVYGHGAAATPPMGWNPWNAFRTEVDQARILSVVDTIQHSGLQRAGYRYINIDDGWWLQRRADGEIAIRTAMFPIARTADGGSSFRAWTDQLHARGFKAGLYTDAGRNACSQAFDRSSPNLPVGSVAEREIGLQGFEASDLKTMFQDWGFDYLKVDACGLADFAADSVPVRESAHRALRPLIVRGDALRSDRDAVETHYARIGRLLAELNPDDDYVLSICPWGEAGVRDWGGNHGHLWRTSPDIEPTWDSMLHNFDSASRRELYAGPGRWNDPDMLAVGLGAFDAAHLTEARTHFSLWAMLSAPLLLGFDLTRAPDPLLELLRNPEVIAVDQDPAGNQATLAVDDAPVQVLVKPLSARGERAVLLFNRGDAPAVAQVDARQMKLAAGTAFAVRDLWRRRDLPPQRGPLRYSLAPHAAVMLKVKGAPVEADATLLSEITGRIHVAADGLPTYATRLEAASGTPRADVTPYGQPLRIAGNTYAYGIGAHADSRLEVLVRGEFATFSASLGVQESAARDTGTTVFRIYGDARLLYESAPMTARDPPLPVDLPIGNVGVLELVAAAGDVPAGELPPLVVWGHPLLH